MKQKKYNSQIVSENLNDYFKDTKIKCIYFSDDKIMNDTCIITMHGFKNGEKIEEVLDLSNYGFILDYDGEKLGIYFKYVSEYLIKLADRRRKEDFSEIIDLMNKYGLKGNFSELYNFNWKDLYESSTNEEEFYKSLKQFAIKAINEKKSMVAKILNPVFSYETKNTNKNHFDFIRIDVEMLSSFSDMSRDQKIAHIKKYQQAITRQVLRKIESSSKFQNAGIPVNCLKLGLCTMRNSSIVYQFELKTV